MSRTVNEANNKFYINKNKIIVPVNELELEMEKLKRVQEEKELGAILLEAEQAKQAEIDKKLETLELLPLGNKVILEAYPRNPYRKIMEGSIFVDYDGTFKNPDTGETDRLKELVACAKVIEVGPEVKHIRVGDDVYYDTRTVAPIPFMSLGYVLCAEQQIFCVINEGLKARFNMS